MLQAGEPSVKANPYGALHNSHMPNYTGGFTLLLHGGCFLFLVVVVDWVFVFSNEFGNLTFLFPKNLIELRAHFA